MFDLIKTLARVFAVVFAAVIKVTKVGPAVGLPGLTSLIIFSMVEGGALPGAGGGNVNRLILLQCNTGPLWARVQHSSASGMILLISLGLCHDDTTLVVLQCFFLSLWHVRALL